MGNHLDTTRVEAMTRIMMQSINANYEAGPVHLDRVIEALNALAICVAYVLKGTRCDPLTLRFFNQAVADQIAAIDRNEEDNNSDETQSG